MRAAPDLPSHDFASDFAPEDIAMTSTLSRHDTGSLRILTYSIPAPAAAQPRLDATIAVPVARPAGVDELARFAVGDTMVLPTDAPPHKPRHAAPTIYPQLDWRPQGYRSRHRGPAAWPQVLIGVGLTVALALIWSAGFFSALIVNGVVR